MTKLEIGEHSSFSIIKQICVQGDHKNSTIKIWYQLELVKNLNCLIGIINTCSDNLVILKFQNFRVD